MHRIDGANSNPTGHFSDGDPMVPRPPTSLNAAWCEAVQEEIAKVIESAGITLETSGTETKDQLLTALAVVGLTASNASPYKGSANAGRVRSYLYPGADGTHGTRLDITINAAWSGTQWVPDSAVSPSILLRLSCGASGGIAPSAASANLYRNDSGAAFSDSAWAQGVNLSHGLTYGAHWADAGGGTTPGKYRYTELGTGVRLQGAVQNDGSVGTVATLPAGYVPATTHVFPAVYFDGAAWQHCMVQVSTSGDITTDAATGAAHVLRLDGIVFPLVD